MVMVFHLLFAVDGLFMPQQVSRLALQNNTNLAQGVESHAFDFA
jgi:hypothetical protein